MATGKTTGHIVCTRCVMDTTVPSIKFDANGECNFCKIHDRLEKRYVEDPQGDALKQVVAAVRKAGVGRKYDVICGTSGGRDSTWTLWVATKILGLRVLAVHFDNGWNSAIATRNIYNACSALDIDLETYVVDWMEFRDLQKSFLKASVPDVEVPTDVAIHAVMHRYAEQEGIKYIFNGHSFRTEGVAPLEWTYMDGRYIEKVHEKFGSLPLRTFPNFKLGDFIKHTFVLKTKVVPILNYFPYVPEDVEKIIGGQLGWTHYGGHHHESFYTKFIQSYLLPQKFKVDRRKTECSALVRSGQ
jgi:N-acetyl sugar amidotransferase